MKKVSRSIIYKEKESIGFFIGEGNTLERDFINKLRKRPFMQELDDASVNILRLFNNACYICTLVFEGDYPLLDLKEYEKIAIDGHDDPIWIDHIFPVTMALVENWLNSEESKQLCKDNSQKKNIEEFCKGICVSIEERNTLPNEGIEDFRALTSCEHCLPSGFLIERCFQRRPVAEVLVDSTIGKYEVFDNTEYLFDIIKNNTNELTAALESDYIKEMVSKLSINENEVISRLTEWLESKSNNAKEKPTVIEQAFNGQTGLPCFTNRQMGILMAAIGRITEKDNPPGKTTLGDIVQRIAGYKSRTSSQNMRGTISEDDKKIVADVLRNQFPNLADEVMKIF